MSESKFYDLHVTGLGYLNRVRMVKPSKGGNKGDATLWLSSALLSPSPPPPLI